MSSPALLRENQAARYLAIGARTLRKLRQEGALHYVRIRGGIRYAVEDLDRYIESARQCQSVLAPAPLTTGMISPSGVVDFEEARNRRMNARPASPKRI